MRAMFASVFPFLFRATQQPTPSAEQEKIFAHYRHEVLVLYAMGLLFVGSVALLLWGAVDAVVFVGNRQHIEVFREWRAGLFGLTATSFGLLAVWRGLRERVLWLAYIVAALGGGWTGWCIGRLEPSAQMWAFGAELMPLIPVLAPLGWGSRLCLTCFMALPYPLVFFVAHSVHQISAKILFTVGLTMFPLVMSLLFGHFIYLLLRDHFLQRLLLAERAKAVEESERKKEEFFANVTHELRTPLTLILGALRRAKDQAQQQGGVLLGMLDAGMRNAGRLLLLIEQLLQISRMGGESKAYEKPEELDVAAFTESIVANFRDSRATEAEWTFSCVERPFVWIEPIRFKDLLYNLIGNAIKFTPQKGGRIEVIVSVEGEFVRIVVKDNGPGIAVEEQQSVFDRFHQARLGALRYGGSGIGLALCKEIVTRYQGEIGVESSVGKGAAFWFTLPLLRLRKSEQSTHPLLTIPSEKRSSIADDSLSLNYSFLPDGASSDGLSSDGLSSDGLSSDGLSSDGLSSDGLSSDGLFLLESSLDADDPFETAQFEQARAAGASKRSLLYQLSLSRPLFGEVVSSERALVSSDTSSLEEGALMSSGRPTTLPEGKRTKGDGARVLRAALEVEDERALLVLVEDDIDLRFYVRDLLSREFAVFEAGDGFDGFALIKKVRPELIVCDQMMPRMSGREVLRAVRNDAMLREIPFLMLTAQGGLESRLEALEAGASDYLLKPFHEGELLMRLNNLLKAYRQSLQHRRMGEQILRLNHRLVEQISDQTRSLQDLARQSESLRDDERSYIAQELHDQLGQYLTGLRFEIDILLMREDLLAEVREGLEACETLLTQLTETVRQVLTELRPTALARSGLLSALRWLIRSFQRRQRPRVSLEVEGEIPEIGEEATIDIFRIAQEGLNNALKYAQASAVVVYLTYTDNTLRLEIRDDGIGITASQAQRSTGLGILGMQERARSHQGTFRIVGGLEKGTTVEVALPWCQKQEGEKQ